LLGALLTFWSFGYTIMRGSDLWWHVASGQWMLRNRSLPATDPWSFTREGQPWLHHEWLSDVVYALWVDWFGIEWLAWWKWGVILLTFLLLFRTIQRLGQDWLAGYLSVLLAIAVAAPFMDVRPHLYSLLGYALLLRLTLVPPRRLWLLPPLFLLWANLHGGFFFGLRALGASLAPDLLWGDHRKLIEAVLIVPACAVSALVNPNGLEAFAYPLKYAADPTSPFRSLREWHPPWLPGGIESPIYWPAIAVFVAVVLVWLGRRGIRERDRVGLAALLLGALTLAMSLRSRRFIPLFGLSQTLLVGPMLALALSGLQRRLPDWLAPVLAVALGMFWLAPFPQSARAFHYLTNEDSFPVDTCDFIEANKLSGRVFAYYNWGGYLHLRTAGRMKVYIDGRADTVYDAGTYNRYVEVLGGRPGWMEIVESSAADYFLWPVDLGPQPFELLQTGRWNLLYEDTVSLLLARRGSEPANLAPPPDSAYRYLTLGTQILNRTPWPCSTPDCTRRLEEAEGHFARSLEMLPNLGRTCFSLAQVQAMQGKVDEASRTMRRCQAVYPFPTRQRSFESLLQRVESLGPTGS
jgi:hypothetical protein